MMLTGKNLVRIIVIAAMVSQGPQYLQSQHSQHGPGCHQAVCDDFKSCWNHSVHQFRIAQRRCYEQAERLTAPCFVIARALPHPARAYAVALCAAAKAEEYSWCIGPEENRLCNRQRTCCTFHLPPPRQSGDRYCSAYFSNCPIACW